MASKVGSALLWLAIAAVVVVGVRAMMSGQVRTEKLPAPAVDEQASGHSETAVFAGGASGACRLRTSASKAWRRRGRATPAGRKRRRTTGPFRARRPGTRRA